MVVETLVGGLVGGFFRCVPELLNFFDKKHERTHELSMQDKALEFQKLKGDQRVEEIETKGQQDWNVGALDALKEAIKSQTVEFKPTGIKWVDIMMALLVFINASVRPVITYWFFGLYLFAKLAMFASMWHSNQHDGIVMAKVLWAEGDQGLWAGILNFWFLGRVFERVK